MYFLLKRRRRCSFLLINPLGLIPVVEGRLLLWIPEGIKESPMLLFSPDDDHTGDDTNHSGGVKEICERVIGKKECARAFMCSFFCLFFLTFSFFVTFLCRFFYVQSLLHSFKKKVFVCFGLFVPYILYFLLPVSHIITPCWFHAADIQ